MLAQPKGLCCGVAVSMGSDMGHCRTLVARQVLLL